MKYKHIHMGTLSLWIFFLTCTLWSQKQWQNLTDRQFVFARFTYSHLNAGKKRAFEEMRTFNLHPVLKSLEKKFNISINADQFYHFLEKGNLSEISEEGILMTNSYIWKTANKKTNRAEIELKVNYDDNMQILNYTYQVTLKVGGKVRAIYFDNVTEKSDIIPRILSHIGAGISERNFAVQKHLDSNQQSKASGISVGRHYETEGKIKDMIAEYIKTLTSENKKKFKEDLIKHLKDEVK